MSQSRPGRVAGHGTNRRSERLQARVRGVPDVVSHEPFICRECREFRSRRSQVETEPVGQPLVILDVFRQKAVGAGLPPAPHAPGSGAVGAGARWRGQPRAPRACVVGGGQGTVADRTV